MKDGGPAFPATVMVSGPYGDRTTMTGGMSLRDYLAAAALQGLLCQAAAMKLESPPVDLASEVAYRYADAMLAEREKSNGP